ncbi:MAG: hypothetical protein IKQ01_03365 [Bacteroidales bacterium]|nr:hypothetical protein [Bacteroidales bacterium]
MSRYNHSSVIKREVERTVDYIQRNYAKKESDPLSNIDFATSDAIQYVEFTLQKKSRKFQSEDSLLSFIRKATLDYFRNKGFRKAFLDGDERRLGIFMNTRNPHPLAFYHDAKRLVYEEFSSSAAALDLTTLVDDACLSLYKTHCKDAKGNDIYGIVGHLRKTMRNRAIDQLKTLGMYKPAANKKADSQEESDQAANMIHEEEPMKNTKRIPRNMIRWIDNKANPIDLPEEEDFMADLVGKDLQKKIDEEPMVYWMTIAEFAEYHYGFKDEELKEVFKAVLAYKYEDKFNELPTKESVAAVAKAYKMEMATVSSQFYRGMKKIKAMGAENADRLIACLRANYAQI